MRLVILCLAVAAAGAVSLHKKHPCDDVDCKAGRECVLVENQPNCLCIISCPDHFKPVCGTDGSSFDNHCKLHQHACLTGHHISIQHKGYCKKSLEKKLLKDKRKSLLSKVDLEEELQNDLIESLKKNEKKNKRGGNSKKGPAVCYGPQRNALRFLLVEHWTEALKDQPLRVEGKTSYRESLWGWFFKCDTDKDNFLTPDELLNCSKEVAFFARPGQDNELTKALCVDALVDDGDRNRDWRLDFEEFTRIMDPKYEPKEKKCSLEGQNYVDGEEVHVDCNHCICAVGNWVCASTGCVETKPKTKIHKSFGHSNEIDNAIDTVGNPTSTSDHKQNGVLDGSAALDLWTENNKKDKKKAKEMLADDFDVKDNMFLDFDLDKDEEKGVKNEDELDLDEYYDDLVEKSKTKFSKKKKLQLEKALKEVKLLKKKTEQLQLILNKNKERDYEHDEQPLPVVVKKDHNSSKKMVHFKKNNEHKTVDSKSKHHRDDAFDKTEWNDLLDWGKHKNSKNSNHHSKKLASHNLF